MTDISMRQFILHVAKRVEHIYRKQGNRFTPMYHAIDAGGHEYVFVAPPVDKDESVRQARAFLAKCEAVRVAFMDEAWILAAENTKDDVDKIFREGKTLSEHPDRAEVIMIHVEDATEGMLMGSMEIIRHGSRVILGKLKITQFDQSEGRMVGLLPTLRNTTKH